MCMYMYVVVYVFKIIKNHIMQAKCNAMLLFGIRGYNIFEVQLKSSEVFLETACELCVASY